MKTEPKAEHFHLLDTNLIIYAIDSTSPNNQLSTELFKLIKLNLLKAAISQQNILEVENVLIFKYKVSVSETLSIVEKILHSFEFRIIAPLQTTYLLHNLILKKVSGKVFDCFLAATMLDNAINKIITFNTKDFKNIPEIKAYDPKEVVEKLS